MDFGSLIAAADFSWLSPGSWWAIAQVVIGIGLVIFIHELGHFLVAKACGVKCEKFYVGFDFFDVRIGDRVLIPRSLVKFQYGETEYGVGIMPLGGYVKMLGQEDNPSSIEQENRRATGEPGGLEAGEGGSGPGGSPVRELPPLDPRSFQAKSVLQRMAIISAGVVFNLVSAVLLGAIAFLCGVRYEPAAVGATTVGGPAWRANVGGGRILSINGKRTDESYFPFSDLIQETMLHGDEEAMQLELQSFGDSRTRLVQVTPQTGLVPGINMPMIGMGRENAAAVGGKADSIVPGSAAALAQPPLQPGDQIVSINGIALPDFEIDGRRMVPVTEMRRLLTVFADQSVKMTVRRGEQTLDVQVPVNPAPRTGLVMQISPVIAVQEESPADRAGIRAGDLLVTLDGEPVGDLLTLDQRIARRIREHGADSSGTPLILEIGLKRVGGGDEVETVEIQPRTPLEPSNPGTDPMAVSTLGVAVHPTAFVGEVVPGSPADLAGIRSGDRIRKVKLWLPEKVAAGSRLNAWREIIETNRREREPGIFQKLLGIPPKPADDRMGEAIGMFRDLPAGTRFELQVEREGKPQPPAILATETSSGEFLATRGMVLTPLESVYTAKSFGEALQLGVRQTWNDAGRIGKTLKKLLSGQISPTNLGGPGTIAIVATMEASEGTSRLLLFLVMLSANLAIINFLPIPVLDGGHMVFLAYEGIFRRPVTERVQIMLSYVGLFFILGLMVFVFSLDISRIFTLLR